MKIAICKDWAGWHEKFAQALNDYKSQGIEISYSVLNMDCVDWQEKIASYDTIVWNPHYMGIRLASHYKEKIYFMQYILNKLVFPGFGTIWHFESKVAESYLFDHYGIKTPKTFVSFDYIEACQEIKSTDFPIVFKRSEGASSQNVRLFRNKKQLKWALEEIFCDQLWGKVRPGTTKSQFILGNFTKQWFWFWILRKSGFGHGDDGVVYWQEFIPDNRADLRITVVGDRFAYGFWRNNRPNDFRASGSGLIDYEREVPKELIQYCLKINKELNFDSMCYDILFTKDSFVINEMSYSYIDRAIFNAPGYYEKLSDDTIEFRNGHYWPEELWVKWVLLKTGYLQLA